MTSTHIVDITNAEHYTWGDGCDGWHLLKSEGLSVISETMPPGTMEKLHYHERAQQFFFILKGEATFEIEGRVVVVAEHKGLPIPPLTKHRISNEATSNLEFLVISAPKSHGDRVNMEERIV